MATQTMSNVTVGVVKGMSVNVPKCCEVQFLTNSVDLLEGEELILEVPEKKPKQAAPKRTWRHALKEDEAKDQNKKRKEAHP